MHFTRFHSQHLRLFTPQPVQVREYAYLLQPNVGAALETTLAMTGWDGSRCLGCAGVVSEDPGAGYAWAMLSVEAGPHMLAITRHVRYTFSKLPYPALYFDVAPGHEEGARWARLLGFREVSPWRFERIQ